MVFKKWVKNRQTPGYYGKHMVYNFSNSSIIDLFLAAGDAGGNSLTMASRSKFYEEAAWELLKARTILCSSYVYGYFHLEEHKTSKSWFELMQHELEDMTEKLSEMLQVNSINIGFLDFFK